MIFVLCAPQFFVVFVINLCIPSLIMSIHVSPLKLFYPPFGKPPSFASLDFCTVRNKIYPVHVATIEFYKDEYKIDL